MPGMKIEVLLFASLHEIAGTKRLSLEVAEAATLASVRAELAARWPALGQIPYVFARNRDYARDDELLVDGDEIACVPAISGGEELGDRGPQVARCAFEFSQQQLDPRPLEERVRQDLDGAIVTFHGVTRDHHEGRAVARLAYEAYEPMAIEKGLALLEEIAASQEISRMHVVHRLGEVPIGEASILVVVASAHRGPAFEAARQAMDRIKGEVPIFKKEFFADSEGTHWVGDLPELD